MKYSLLFLAFWALPSFASSKLDNPDILGEYTLQPRNKNSDVQTAQIRINVDKKIVVTLNDDDNEFELTEPNAKGVIYDGDDEPNCDGDEENCYYNASTVIRLKTKGRGSKAVPQLQVTIEKVNAFNESGDDDSTTTYVLNWSRELPDALPFFTNAKTPASLSALLESCKTLVVPTVGQGGIGNFSDICTSTNTYDYRGGFSEAFKYMLRARGGGSKKETKKITPARLQSKVFGAVDKMIDGLESKDLKVSKKQLKAEVKKIETYILENSELLYLYQYTDTAIVFSVNKNEKVITIYHITTGR